MEPPSLKEARRAFLGQPIKKRFPDPKLGGKERWFNGSVKEVWKHQGVITYDIV